jgi:predicted secreted acid phosphatase
MKPKALICDLDNTLCDAKHRMALFHQRQWDKFEAAIPLDTPNEMVGHFLKFARMRGWKVLFVSGRSAEARTDTIMWLMEHYPGFETFPIYLRARADERPDYQVKRDIYLNQIKPDFDVQLVLDDRTMVVQEWRRLGLECWQVAEGNY